MIFFGHLGIGYRMVSACRRVERADLGWLLLGTIAPDVFDKSAFLISDWFVRPPRLADPFFSGTRTLGHALITTLAVLLAGGVLRSRRVRLFAYGMATHLALDCLSYPLGVRITTWNYSFGVLGWPFTGWDFPVKLWRHRTSGGWALFLYPWMLVMELVGLYAGRPAWRQLRETWRRSARAPRDAPLIK